jgi:hypothetical protein
MEQWEAGEYQKTTPEETFVANAAALEKLAFVREFLDLEYEQYAEVMTDGEFSQKRAEASGKSGPV